MNLVTIKAVMVSRVWLLGLRILDLAEHNLGVWVLQFLGLRILDLVEHNPGVWGSTVSRVWGPTVSWATDFGSDGAITCP